jgi:hypothetical protein
VEVIELAAWVVAVGAAAEAGCETAKTNRAKREAAILGSVLVLMVFLSEQALGPELKGRELNAPQLQAPPGAFHRNTPSRARLGARLDGSVG